MVSGKTTQREAVKEGVKPSTSEGRSHGVSWGMVILIFVTAFTVVSLMLILVMSVVGVKRTENETIVGECPSLDGVVNNDDCVAKHDAVQRVDFQPLVNSWVSSVGGKKGVMIYDLMAGEVVGEYNVDEKFATASVYKLFIVYAGYLKVDSGEWNGGAAAGGTGRTIAECLDLAIRESHSECAETLWDMMGRGWLDVTVREDFGLSGLSVGSLTATPREVMRMMLKYYQHSEILDDKLVAVMKDSFLNQPKTTYDWRQGLPSGFSDVVRVYNKVGWEYDGDKWLIYNDAAIVSFADVDRDFVVVVMTSGVDFKQIAQFGRDLEAKFYDILSFGE